VKSESQFYSVQPLRPTGEDDGGLISTDASSALKAAEKVLGEAVTLHGNVPRAKVWAMNDDFSTTLITVYSPSTA